jgi:hypothetical protein
MAADSASLLPLGRYEGKDLDPEATPFLLSIGKRKKIDKSRAFLVMTKHLLFHLQDTRRKLPKDLEAASPT